MSGDEGVAFFVSAVLGAILWARWYWFILRCPGSPGALLALVPPTCAAALFLALRRWAAHDVRDDPTYLMMYMVMGAAWVGVGARLFAVMALNVREDVINRRNPAAAWLAAGALCGVTACFAGANVGEGPGWWVVVFAGALATAGLFIAWAVMQSFNGAVDSITIDRDVATGLRMASAAACIGVILGHAVAGDWVSASATVADFVRFAWPVLPIVLCESALGRVLRPSPQNPVPSPLTWGAVPALIYVGCTFVSLGILGGAV